MLKDFAAGRPVHINVAAFPDPAGRAVLAKSLAGGRSRVAAVFWWRTKPLRRRSRSCCPRRTVGSVMRETGENAARSDAVARNDPPLPWRSPCVREYTIPSLGHARTQDLFPRVSRMRVFVFLDEVFDEKNDEARLSHWGAERFRLDLREARSSYSFSLPPVLWNSRAQWVRWRREYTHSMSPVGTGSPRRI